MSSTTEQVISFSANLSAAAAPSHDEQYNGWTYTACFDETFAVRRMFSDNKVEVIIVLNTSQVYKSLER